MESSETRSCPDKKFFQRKLSGVRPARKKPGLRRFPDQMRLMMSKLALLGGEKTVTSSPGNLFRWGTVTAEMESEVLKVLHDGNMSGTDITRKFEEGYAQWCGSKYALAHCNGTAALQTAMAAIELGPGDEIICPTITYWASCAQAIPMGARVIFADIDPVSLCIDPRQK